METSEEIVREAVLPALRKNGIVRDNYLFALDGLKRGIRTEEMAEMLQKDGIPGSKEEIAQVLFTMAKRDYAYWRPYANYIGPLHHSKPWNAHEWSVPPQAAEDPRDMPQFNPDAAKFKEAKEF